VLLLAAGSASAQAWPTKPVRILVGFTAGSSIDVVARILAPKLTELWKQPVLIDNRLGAGGNIAAEAVAKAAPDGYTLLNSNAGLAISAAFYRKPLYDALTDLRPITQGVAQPHVLAINTSLPVKSVKDLIALAKARPGQLSFASGGVGNSDHMAGELFVYMAGIKMVHVPYKGAPQALNDTITGEVAMYFPGVPVVLAMAQAGRVKALAVTSRHRLAALPNVPTIAESGVPGYEVILWYGFYGPAAMPAELATRIQTDIARVLKMPDVQERFAALGVEGVGSTPDEFGKFLRAEIAKWQKVRKATGLTID
jgi:tripartite-type tricarboxylate transporter receptor subunit TctC